MDTTKSTRPSATLGAELDVFAKAPHIGQTPSATEISAMIKGGKPGDMDKLDV